MKHGEFIISVAILVFLSIFSGCKKKSTEDNVNYAKGYQGHILLEYSRDFPSFSAKDFLPVTVNSDGELASGSTVSCPIVTEDTLYDGAEPKLRMSLNGSMTFYEAKGSTFTLNGIQYISVLVHSTVQYQVMVWVWIKQTMQWQLELNTPFTYSDTYGNGPMQFSMNDAQLDGSSIKATLPDLQGNFTYGYTLFLLPNP
jgi:hypothetical protein